MTDETLAEGRKAGYEHELAQKAWEMRDVTMPGDTPPVAPRNPWLRSPNARLYGRPYPAWKAREAHDWDAGFWQGQQAARDEIAGGP